jgi:hypothetical protein
VGLTVERIRGRIVAIESEDVEGMGWVAVGWIREGLPHEKGLRFEARGTTASEAEQRLQAEIEAYFA